MTDGRAARTRPPRGAAVAVVLPLLLAGAPAALVLGSASPASAEEYYAVPAGGLPITGHGYGHGHGMGQYGAQGAALQGIGYRDILAHYYPGTSVGPLPAPSTVRVLISEDTDDDLTVRPDPGLALADADGARWELPPGPTAWRVRADAAAAQHVEQLVGGAWQPWTSPDGRSAFTQLRAEGPARVRVDLPGGGGRAYRGTVTAVRVSGTAIDTVNTVDFEKYLYGVVPRESPASWRPAALQAQAVAARTYSAWKRAASTAKGYDLCSTTACQVYGGSASYGTSGTLTELETASTDAAVDSTAGEVRLYGGKPAFTEFSASTGGWNSAGGQPYLVAGADPWDDFSGNPVHTWTATLSPSAIGAAYPSVGSVRALRVLARDGGGEWGGRITSLSVEGVSPTGAVLRQTVSGNDFRSRLGLRSEWFHAEASAITLHWLELGGASGPLGDALGAEYDVPGGRAQDFRGGRVYWSPSTGAREVHGGVLERYLALGGPGGALGLPTSDETAAPGGAGNTFTGGDLWWSPSTGALVVRGDVRARWRALGGPTGRFGLPLTEEQADGPGVRQRFAHGGVWWSAGTGAQPVEGAVGDLYAALGGAAGPLSLPLAAEEDVRGGRQQRFAGGRVLWSPSTGAHELYGGILGAWLRTGGPDGVLGLPRTGEQDVPGGRRQSFSGGAVYWSPATDAQPLYGDVLAAYARLGESGGLLGFPTVPEAAVPGGTRARFSGGELYWSPTTGAHEVHGAVLSRYLAVGGAGGVLGLPTADEAAVPGGRGSTFRGGAVYWSAATDAHEVHGAIAAEYARRGGPSSALGLPVSDEYAVSGGARNDFRTAALVWRAATDDVVQVPR